MRAAEKFAASELKGSRLSPKLLELARQDLVQHKLDELRGIASPAAREEAETGPREPEPTEGDRARPPTPASGVEDPAQSAPGSKIEVEGEPELEAVASAPQGPSNAPVQATGGTLPDSSTDMGDAISDGAAEKASLTEWEASCLLLREELTDYRDVLEKVGPPEHLEACTLRIERFSVLERADPEKTEHHSLIAYQLTMILAFTEMDGGPADLGSVEMRRRIHAYAEVALERAGLQRVS